MSRCSRWASLAISLAALGGGLGCQQILGIEARELDTSCQTAFDCRLSGTGRFCVTGECVAAPPASTLCHQLEPQEGAVGAIDWSQDPPILGTLFRENNSGELPRLEAMRLAVREINDSGKMGPGRDLTMIVCDYGGADGSVEGDEEEQLIHQGVDYLSAVLGAPVIISGSSSSATQIAIDRILTQGYPTAFISSFSTSTQLTGYPDKLGDSDPFGLLWRTSTNDAFQAQVLARLIDATSGVTKIAIAYVDDAYGRPLQQGVKDALDALGSGQDSSLHPFDETIDLTDLVDDIANEGADSLLVIGIDGQIVVDIYNEVVAAGLQDSFLSCFLADAAKDAETLLADPDVHVLVARARGTAPYHSDAAHYDTFEQNIYNEFEVEAADYSFLAQSYDAAYMAAYGLAFAGAKDGSAADGRRVAEGFSRLVSGNAIIVDSSTWPSALNTLTSGADADRHIDIDGKSGPLDFDVPTGDAPGPIEIWRASSDLSGLETCDSCQTTEECDLSGSDCFQ